jgi:hypothetical protein
MHSIVAAARAKNQAPAVGAKGRWAKLKSESIAFHPPMALFLVPRLLIMLYAVVWGTGFSLTFPTIRLAHCPNPSSPPTPISPPTSPNFPSPPSGLKSVAVKADSDNVIVGVRIRPFNSIELAEKNVEPAFKKVGKQMIRECHQNELAGVQGKEYVYDHVFGPKNNTGDVYERLAKPLIEKSMEGFNGTIFAYGQTSSGKVS